MREMIHCSTKQCHSSLTQERMWAQNTHHTVQGYRCSRSSVCHQCLHKKRKRLNTQKEKVTTVILFCSKAVTMHRWRQYERAFISYSSADRVADTEQIPLALNFLTPAALVKPIIVCACTALHIKRDARSRGKCMYELYRMQEKAVACLSQENN